MEALNATNNCNATVLAPFHSPHIPVVSDRYAVFLFVQPGAVSFAPLSPVITNWDAAAFVAMYDLKLIASNFFVSVFVSASPFSGAPFSGNDVSGVWHHGVGTGQLTNQSAPVQC